MAEGGTENPSESFSGSGIGSAGGGGERGSLSSGIDSCNVPLIAVELEGGSLAGPGLVPFGRSVLDRRVRFGELEASDARGVKESLRTGETGRSEDEPGASRSFDFPLPNPLNAAPRLEDDFFPSGDDARPYGCTLCLRLPNTVPNRLRP